MIAARARWLCRKSFFRCMQFARFSEKELFGFCLRLPNDFCVIFRLPYDFCVITTAEILSVSNTLRFESALHWSVDFARFDWTMVAKWRNARLSVAASKRSDWCPVDLVLSLIILPWFDMFYFTLLSVQIGIQVYASLEYRSKRIVIFQRKTVWWSIVIGFKMRGNWEPYNWVLFFFFEWVLRTQNNSLLLKLKVIEDFVHKFSKLKRILLNFFNKIRFKVTFWKVTVSCICPGWVSLKQCKNCLKITSEKYVHAKIPCKR